MPLREKTMYPTNADRPRNRGRNKALGSAGGKGTPRGAGVKPGAALENVASPELLSQLLEEFIRLKDEAWALTRDEDQPEPGEPRSHVIDPEVLASRIDAMPEGTQKRKALRLYKEALETDEMATRVASVLQEEAEARYSAGERKHVAKRG